MESEKEEDGREISKRRRWLEKGREEKRLLKKGKVMEGDKRRWRK